MVLDIIIGAHKGRFFNYSNLHYLKINMLKELLHLYELSSKIRIGCLQSINQSDL